MPSQDRVAIDTILLEEPSLAATKYPYAATLSVLNSLYAPEAQHPKFAVIDTAFEAIAVPSPAQPSPEAILKAGTLAKNARAAAEAHACSSALAGHSSESDDFVDVGLAIGTSTEMDSNAVLEKLGLGDVLEDIEVSSIPLSRDTHLPTAFRASTDNPIVTALSNDLNALQGLFAFTARRLNDPSVLYFLLGQTKDHEWIGLLGAGTSSD